MHTTLDLIRTQDPCKEGWKKLLQYLGKTTSDSEPLSLLTILESNGLEDAVWCLRATPDSDSKARLFAVFCARQVQHLNPDPEVAEAIDTAEAFALGKVTKEELAAAHGAAYYVAAAPCYASAANACYAAYYVAYCVSTAHYASTAAVAQQAKQDQAAYFKELFK